MSVSTSWENHGGFFFKVFPMGPDSTFISQIRQQRAKGCVKEQEGGAEPK